MRKKIKVNSRPAFFSSLIKFNEENQNFGLGINLGVAHDGGRLKAFFNEDELIQKPEFQDSSLNLMREEKKGGRELIFIFFLINN